MTALIYTQHVAPLNPIALAVIGEKDFFEKKRREEQFYTALRCDQDYIEAIGSIRLKMNEAAEKECKDERIKYEAKQLNHEQAMRDLFARYSSIGTSQGGSTQHFDHHSFEIIHTLQLKIAELKREIVELTNQMNQKMLEMKPVLEAEKLEKFNQDLDNIMYTDDKIPEVVDKESALRLVKREIESINNILNNYKRQYHYTLEDLSYDIVDIDAQIRSLSMEHDHLEARLNALNPLYRHYSISYAKIIEIDTKIDLLEKQKEQLLDQGVVVREQYEAIEGTLLQKIDQLQDKADQLTVEVNDLNRAVQAKYIPIAIEKRRRRDAEQQDKEATLMNPYLNKIDEAHKNVKVLEGQRTIALKNPAKAQDLHVSTQTQSLKNT